MAMQSPQQSTDTDDPTTETLVPDIGAMRRRLFRDQYTTKNVKRLFAAVMAVVLLGTIYWISQQPFKGQLGIDMGTTVGYLAMGLFVGLVLAVVVSVVFKSAYLMGHRLVGRTSR